MKKLNIEEQVIGSCNCSNKTPEVKHHDELCYFRLLMEKTEPVAKSPAAMAGSMVIVSLGDTYADRCVVCGERGEWGLASKKGPEGCQEALNNGKVYCKTHLP